MWGGCVFTELLAIVIVKIQNQKETKFQKVEEENILTICKELKNSGHTHTLNTHTRIHTEKERE